MSAALRSDRSAPAPIDARLIGAILAREAVSYDERDAMLYALSVGAGAVERELTCEIGGLVTLPTFATSLMARPVPAALAALGVDLTRAIHVGQRLSLRAPLPPQGELVASVALRAAYEVEGAALVELDTALVPPGGHEPVAEGSSHLVCRDHGGFGGALPPERTEVAVPAGAPDFETTQPTSAEQALLFRLNGDRNPIHALPSAAAVFGWPRPILHGLFTFGALGLAFVRQACAGDPRRLRALSGRFRAVAFPGDALVHAGWRVGPRSWVGMSRSEDGRLLLSHVRARCEGPLGKPGGIAR